MGWWFLGPCHFAGEVAPKLVSFPQARVLVSKLAFAVDFFFFPFPISISQSLLVSAMPTASPHSCGIAAGLPNKQCLLLQVTIAAYWLKP